MYQVTIGPKDPQITVLIVQTLGFHKSEIRPWDAAVQVGYYTVKISPFLCSSTIISKEVGSMNQATLGPKDS